MNKQLAAQVFSVLAVIIGLIVSYYPPPVNAAAIWGLVGTFIGYAMHELFNDAPVPQVVNKSEVLEKVEKLNE